MAVRVWVGGILPERDEALVAVRVWVGGILPERDEALVEEYGYGSVAYFLSRMKLWWRSTGMGRWHTS